MHRADRPFLSQPGQTNSRWFGPNLLTLLATAEQTCDRLTVMEVLLGPGGILPRHTHTLDDEALYLLEGTLECSVGDETSIAAAGDLVWMAAGPDHFFRPQGESARALLLSAPAGIERAFHALSVPACRREVRREASRPNVQRMIEEFEACGLSFCIPDGRVMKRVETPDWIARRDASVPRFPNQLVTKTLIGSARTQGRLGVCELIGRAGSEWPSHVHSHEDEAFYVLDGIMKVCCGREESVVRAGELIWLPRGVPHHVRFQTESVRCLVFVTPAGLEQFLTCHSPPAPFASAGFPQTPPTNEDLTRSGAKYGLRFVEDS
jgi:quercetin dioxygenase-like cupin family protein